MRFSAPGNFIALILTLFLFVALSESVRAAEIRLAWDPNTEEGLAGYVVYYGTATGRYRWMVDLGNVTTYDLTRLTPGVTYFIALTAYDTSNNESVFSNEVSGVGMLMPPNVTSFAIDNGAGSTASRTVTLNNTAINSPTHYMASESSSFFRARWVVYSGAPNFTLSAGAGIKTIYFKVKNSIGESPVVSDTITLE